MTEPRYPGVADADATRAARSSDPYGGDASGRRSSGYGYSGSDQASPQGRPTRADRRGYQPEYADPSGRGYGVPGGNGASPGGYPTAYSGPTGYDPSGGYDAGGDRRRYGRSGQRTPGATSPASRVASAMRRSVASAARGPRGPRRARLQLKHVDPWSTLKLALVLSVALFVVWLVAVGILYGVLDGMGVFDKVNGLYEDVTGKDGAQLIGPGLVLGIAALLGAINIVLFTALATIGSFIYNMCADLVGGVELTLGEGD